MIAIAQVAPLDEALRASWADASRRKSGESFPADDGGRAAKPL